MHIMKKKTLHGYKPIMGDLQKNRKKRRKKTAMHLLNQAERENLELCLCTHLHWALDPTGPGWPRPRNHQSILSPSLSWSFCAFPIHLSGVPGLLSSPSALLLHAAWVSGRSHPYTLEYSNRATCIQHDLKRTREITHTHSLLWVSTPFQEKTAWEREENKSIDSPEVFLRESK